MENSLTKDQLCWVLIRILGVYLIFQSIIAFVTLAATFVSVGNMSNSIPGIESGDWMGYLVTPGLLTVTLAILGIYLLRSGKAIHDLLMQEPATSFLPRKRPQPKIEPDPMDEVDPDTTLTRRETEAFLKWIESHPEFQKRSRVDQVALFRDAQKSEEED